MLSVVDLEQARFEALAKYQTEVQPHLDQGEALYAAISVELNSNIKTPPQKILRSSGAVGRNSTILRRLEPFVQPIDAVAGFLLRVGEGKVMEGGWHSQAGHLVIAAFPCSKAEGSILRASFRVAITDRRAFFIYIPSRSSRRPAGVVASYGPKDLHRREQYQHKQGEKRVDVSFTDGSWLALQAASPQEAFLLQKLLNDRLS